jgi:hypothetical protein
MGSRNSLQSNSEFSPEEESKLSDKFSSTVSLYNQETSAESSPSQTVTQEKPEELVKRNEKPQIKFPFAFISEENIPHISVVVQNGNAITFTMNSKAIYDSESDPAQLSPSVTLENLDPTISREGLAQLPMKIFPPLLGWEGISCETLKLHNLLIDKKLFKAIVTSGVKQLHILNCTVVPRLGLTFEDMKTLGELNISLLNFNKFISTPTSLETLIVRCLKSTADLSKEQSESLRLQLTLSHSASLGHV